MHTYVWRFHLWCTMYFSCCDVHSAVFVSNRKQNNSHLGRTRCVQAQFFLWIFMDQIPLVARFLLGFRINWFCHNPYISALGITSENSADLFFKKIARQKAIMIFRQSWRKEAISISISILIFSTRQFSCILMFYTRGSWIFYDMCAAVCSKCTSSQFSDTNIDHCKTVEVHESQRVSSVCHGRCTTGVAFHLAIDIELWWQGTNNQYQNLHPAGIQERKAHTYIPEHHTHSAVSCIISGAHSLSIRCWYPMRLGILYCLLTIPLYVLPTSHTHETQQAKSLQQGCI